MPKITLQTDIPDNFICPITQEVMNDPVATIDGHIYERKAISEWFQKYDTSPLTNLPLQNKTLIPIPLLKQIIQDYKDKQKPCSYEDFIAAVKSGNPENVEKLNYPSEYITEPLGLVPVLFIPLEQKNTAMVEYLLKNGADPKSSLPCNGITALQIATKKKLSDIVKILLNYGACPDQHDWGEDELIPILIAARKDSLEIVKLLVNHQASLDLPDFNTGWCVLHHAVKNENMEMIDYLLNIDPDLGRFTDYEEKSPYDLALELKLNDIAQHISNKVIVSCINKVEADHSQGTTLFWEKGKAKENTSTTYEL